MLARRRFLGLLCILALLIGALLAPGGGSAAAEGGATASKRGKAKAKGKRCPKGYVPKTVRKNGKKVRKCRKRPGKGKGGGGAPAPGSGGLFEAPGTRLEGEAAKPFLEKYLLNSTFTDCPAGFPACSVENLYSHTSGGSFFYCRLTLTSGADIINGARAYQVQNVVVEADGSWTFNEVVDNYGNPSYYEWHVGTDGVVTGAYQYNGVEQIGPLQYVSGARDCSY